MKTNKRRKRKFKGYRFEWRAVYFTRIIEALKECGLYERVMQLGYENHED
jgi:hypothetical protein